MRERPANPPLVFCCERCGETLNPDTMVELELDTVTGKFYNPVDFPKDGLSQGCFPFGRACADQVIKTGKLTRIRRRS